MSGHEVHRDVTGDGAKVLEAAAQGLAKLGYEVTSREAGRVRTKHRGKVFTAEMAKARHFLDISADGSNLRFHFHTGLMASTWSDDDRAWAETRVDQVLADIVGV